MAKKCPQCDRTFNDGQALLNHRVASHGGACAVSTSVVGYILCKHPDCSRSTYNFPSQAALQDHTRSAHNGLGNSAPRTAPSARSNSGSSTRGSLSPAAVQRPRTSSGTSRSTPSKKNSTLNTPKRQTYSCGHSDCSFTSDSLDALRQHTQGKHKHAPSSSPSLSNTSPRRVSAPPRSAPAVQYVDRYVDRPVYISPPRQFNSASGSDIFYTAPSTARYSPESFVQELPSTFPTPPESPTQARRTNGAPSPSRGGFLFDKDGAATAAFALIFGAATEPMLPTPKSLEPELLRLRDPDEHEHRLRLLMASRESELKTLNGDVAAEMLNYLYQFRRETATDDPLSIKANNIMVRLSMHSRTLPSNAFLNHVSRAKSDEGFLLDSIYEGGFGEVYKGEYGEIKVAIKKLRPIGSTTSKRMKKEFLKEFMILCDLHHRYIVPFLGVCFDVQGLEKTPCLIFHWMENGSLESLLEKTKLEQPMLLQMVFELTQVLEFLHKRAIPVVHGDLNTKNILVDSALHIQLTDFGLSRTATRYSTNSSNGVAGTLLWQAPEFFNQEDEEEEEVEDDTDEDTPDVNPSQRRSPASDVWAFGCTVLEMFSGSCPFAYLAAAKRNSPRRIPNDHKFLTAIRDGQLPALVCPDERDDGVRSSMPSELWDILLLCWKKDPAERPNMTDVKDNVVALLQPCSS